MWKCSSAGVRTSDSSMKSTPSASRICASTKCPIRALAITGMLTRLLDLPDLADGGHARDAAVAPDVGGHALERHHRRRAGLLGDARLLGVGHVHDHPALQHLGEADVLPVGDPEAVRVGHRCAAPCSFQLRGLAAPGSHHQRLDPLGPLRRRTGAPAPPPVGDRLGEAADAVVDPARGHRGEREPRRALAAPVEEEPGAGGEAHPPAERPGQERRRVAARRQREEKREAPSRLRPGRHPPACDGRAPRAGRSAAGRTPARSARRGGPAAGARRSDGPRPGSAGSSPGRRAAWPP